jgi:membrane-associated phospholipid phosphatase
MFFLKTARFTIFFFLISLGTFAQVPSQNVDYRILRSINQPVMQHWDAGMRGVSSSIYPVMPLTVAGIWLHGYSESDAEMMRNAYKSAFTIGTALGITVGLKYLIKRSRPFTEHPSDITRRDAVGPLSFPSGHTTSAFASATAISLSYNKWYVTLPSFLYASFVGYSRMRLGVHYPSDVVGGIIVGIGSGLLIWQVDKWLNGTKALPPLPQ